VGLWAAGSAGAASWADGLFEELSKDFGSVPRGPALTHSFRVVNNTKGPVSIASLRVSCGCVSASAQKNFLNPGEETAVVARMDTTRFTGIKSVTIYVQFDRPAFEEVRLWVQANGRDDFSVTPDTLSFGQIKRGSAPSATASLRFFGNTNIQVVEIRSETNYVKPVAKEVRRQDGEVVYEVTANLREDVPVGKWYTDVWLKTNNPSIPQVRVPLTVEIESALSVSPENVNLGEVKVGGEAERRVIVRGIKPFLITGVKGTDDQLSARDGPSEKKAVHVLTVKVKPARDGDLAKTLHVLTDLKEEAEISFQVNAHVVP
jgi:hypothetical protein